MKTSFSKYLSFISLTCLSVSLSLGQTASPSPRAVAWVTIKDGNGFIDSLTSDNIEVKLDNGSLSHLVFEQKSVPTTVGLIIDTSSSAGHVDRSARVAMAGTGFQRFIKVSSPLTEYFVSTFRKNYRTILDPTSDLSKVSSTLADLNGLEKGGYEVAVLDALRSSFSTIFLRPTQKKVLIFVSEGADSDAARISGDNIDLSEIEEIAKKSDTILYFLYPLTDDDFNYQIGVSKQEVKPPILVRELMLRTSMELRSSSLMRFGGPTGGVTPYPLVIAREYEHLANITGGRVFYAYGQNEVQLALEIIANELKHQYLLIGSPESLAAPAKFHRLTIKLRNSQRANVRARTGFYLN